VAGPSRTSLQEAAYFHRRLSEAGMPFVSFVVNRVHPDPAELARAARSERGRPTRVSRELGRVLLEVFQDQQALARAEGRHIDRFQETMRAAVVLVAERETDVHDLRGLKEVGESILATPALRRDGEAARVSDRTAARADRS
jgi:anion-transporting  ArsA/GET3 family ATPase